MNFTCSYLKETKNIIEKINLDSVEKLIDLIFAVKKNKGRIFFLGNGGSAANCSHAVNDFRKILGIECYAPTDNVSEITARTNDEGWDTIFVEWLKISNLCDKDLLFILSVGGGDIEKNISSNLVQAIKYAKLKGSKITGIVGRNGGYTAENSNTCIIIPTVNKDNVTPHTEAFHAIIWHLLVSHPQLKFNQSKKES